MGDYMNKKNGFTLIELLAVIVITSILLILAVPKIINQIKINKENALAANKEIIIAAARNYILDYNLEAPVSIALSDLCDFDYIECPINNPVNDTNLNGYINVNENRVYSYSEEAVVYNPYPILTVNLNGGTTTQTFSSNYYQDTQITLEIPSKNNSKFINWSVTGTGSSITNNVLTIGSSATTITANWEEAKVITLNLNGGASSQTLNSNYFFGDTITLLTPTKSGYTFYNWNVNCTVCLNGSIYTVGNSNDTIIAIWVTTVTNYSYTGGVQTFTIPESGHYKLEVWGAQGGQANSTYYGGYGGYSIGVLNSTKNQILYIYVGGQGNSGCVSTTCAGGYNGGGLGYYGGDSLNYQSGGGGATHISSASGLLSSQNSGNILIAAGGGGGGYYHTNGDGYSMIGATGGGINGTNGKVCTYGVAAAGGGSQTSGGSAGYRGAVGSFGAGGSGYYDAASGGGGGYYGGGSSAHSGTGGGSGYIANSLLLTYGEITKSMYCYNCTTSSTPSTLTYSTTNVSSSATSNYAKSGNGYARITFIGH